MFNTKKTITLLMCIALASCGGSDTAKNSTNGNLRTFLPTNAMDLSTQSGISETIMDARITGVLEEDANGCLRVDDALLIWPYGAFIEDGVIYDANNNLVAVVGESLSLGGGGFSAMEDGDQMINAMSNELPSTQCVSDEYFVVQSY